MELATEKRKVQNTRPRNKATIRFDDQDAPRNIPDTRTVLSNLFGSRMRGKSYPLEKIRSVYREESNRIFSR